MKLARFLFMGSTLCLAACSQHPPEQETQQAKIQADQSVSDRIANRDVTFSAATSSFSVVSTATGKVSNSGPFVSIVLDRHTMRADPRYQTPKKVIGHKVGLAFNRPDGKWDVARWSNAVTQTVVLEPGDTRQVERAEFIIPIDDLPPLNSYWLVLAVELDTGGTVGYTYAHSNRAIFQMGGGH